MRSLITFEDVTKVYDNGQSKITALNGINLEVKEGEIYGVIGLSGAGKSSLIRCVNFLEVPTSGRILVDNHDLTTLSEKQIREVRRNIGMVFQHFNLLNSKTVFTNVAMPLILAKVPKAEIKERVMALLEFVGLKDKANKYPDQLSGGQKQRIGIARALTTNPKILLCDEATSALDPQTTSSILDLLKEVNKTYGITILLITHEMNVIRDICDRVAVLEDGQIIEEGTVFEVFSNPSTKTAKNFVSTVMHDKIPESILNLIAKNNGSRKIYRIVFVGESAGHPLISTIAKKFDIDINILFGQITELQGNAFGNLIVEFIGNTKQVGEALQSIHLSNILIKEVLPSAS